ncbi:MAG: hypothetical protein HY354_05305 [Planctomycetes bacterium]|nr:hypothetical protein [Planctomycetota bacterium]
MARHVVNIIPVKVRVFLFVTKAVAIRMKIKNTTAFKTTNSFHFVFNAVLSRLI